MSDIVRVLVELRDNVSLLPSITVTFGGSHECVPPSLVRAKVLAVIDGYIEKAREAK